MKPTPRPVVPTEPRRPRARFLPLLLLGSAALLVPAALLADWWIGLPADATPQYVGRASCLACHAEQSRRWQGSDHDLAMDHATPQTVLGDFANATLQHDGITSRMYREGDRFLVYTEGPDGTLREFQVKYVFGVRPLQQYLVEFDRQADQPAEEEARLQVLRISWDTEQKRWFYLTPPDVKDKLDPADPLHWTGSAQNWNHMCAVCHSTNVQKNFDLATQRYHTTFSEIDVSCEACHGPASLHVAMAQSRSLFWDRQRGYGLKQLKGESSLTEIETCAPCHSRRTMTYADRGTDARYHDCYTNELLRPESYYPDGQIRDEVFEYGSFVQSKMYHKGIRCSDCHDPHTTRVKASDNQLCTSCHQHPAAKYDTPAHHHHVPGSTGSRCIECHMPATPFMDIDLRRDHSLRVPRPDLSVKWSTPNACTACHLSDTKLSSDETASLTYYADWLQAARDKNEAVAAELRRLDTWAAEWFTRWYGSAARPHFADTLAAAWQRQPATEGALIKLATQIDAAPLVRASALWQLQLQAPEQAQDVATRLLSHRDPQLRSVAVQCLAQGPPDTRLRLLGPRLTDSVRLVRQQAANGLADLPRQQWKVSDQRAFHLALEEYKAAQWLNADLAGAHLMLGILAERQNNPQEAERAYQTAIRIHPTVTGPRSNLAQLYDRLGDAAAATTLRSEELELLARDVRLAPDQAVLQYRYGLALYLMGQAEAAAVALNRACELEPRDADFQLALALLLERLERWSEAWQHLNVVMELRPQDPTLLPIKQRIAAHLP